MTRPLCLVRGSINIDEFFHVPSVVQPGQTLSSTFFERRAGGKGANQSSAVGRAGGRVALVGAVGQDGGDNLGALKDAGVDVSRVVVSDKEATGRAIIQLTPEGENCIILYKGANFLLSPSLLNPAADLSYTHLLLQNEVPFDSTLAYLYHARTIGATTVWNPSPMPSPEELKSVPWGSLDWLLVNEGEVDGLLDALAGPGRQATVEADKTGAETWVRELHEHPNFSRSVGIVCTLGAKGVFALLPSTVDHEVVRLPAARLDGPVRDTTGAGDCFTGYFVAGLMQYQRDAEDVKRALRRAVEASGLCVQRPGAIESIPRVEEVEARLTS